MVGNFLGNLFSSNEKQVDSINVIGVTAAFAMVGLSVATFVHTGSFEPLTLAGGTATIIGAVGGSRRVRDGAASDPGGGSGSGSSGSGS